MNRCHAWRFEQGTESIWTPKSWHGHSMSAPQARRQDYDYLIKLLLIGDSGEAMVLDIQLKADSCPVLLIMCQTVPTLFPRS